MSEEQVGEDLTRIRLVVAPDEAEEVRALAGAHGVATQELTQRSLDPGTIVLLLVGAVAAVAVVQRLVETARGGQVVDLRPGAPSPIYRSRDLHYGLIAVIAVDGVVSIEVVDPKEMFDQVVGIVLQMLRRWSEPRVGEVEEWLSGTLPDATVAVVSPVDDVS